LGHQVCKCASRYDFSLSAANGHVLSLTACNNAVSHNSCITAVLGLLLLLAAPEHGCMYITVECSPVTPGGFFCVLCCSGVHHWVLLDVPEENPASI
jgi:hypothetical protein